MSWNLIVVAIVGFFSIIAIAVLYGLARWRAGTTAWHEKLEAARLPVVPSSHDSRTLEDLPAPVQRYFRAVLTEGQPMVAAVCVEQSGTFNMSEAAEQWRSFTATQRVITRRPGFVWDARIAMMPGVAVRVHDAYVAGEGILHASLFGLVSLIHMRGTPEVAEGEFMRFLAETAWYPTALLPSQGVAWEPIDETAAKATLKDGDTVATLLFRFDGAGLISSVRAEARGRTLNGTVVATPWEGRWWDYQLRDGMRVPLEGEVAWVLPEGRKPYWRARIARLTYEFAR